MAVTLDPEHDDVATLARLGEAQELTAPAFNLLTGEPKQVNAVLDKMGIERHRDEFGVLQHTNLFLVVDRAGTIAYRFSLGDIQEDWLVEAIKLVYAEPEPIHEP